MARRFPFSSRRRAYGTGGGFDSPELRNAERELFLFKRRLGIAGALVVIAFAALFGRFVYLQVVQHRYYQTLAETNRIAIVPIVPNRGVITDRNGVVLAQSYSAYTLEIQPSRVKNLDDTIDALAEVVDVQPRDRKRFKKLLEEIAQLREPAAAHPAHRRRGRALRRQPLPVPGRRDQGPPVPPVSVRRGRLARRRLHRPHQRPRRPADRRVGRDRQLQGLRLHRQGRRRAVLRARAARHDRRRTGGGRCRRPRGAHAGAHAADGGQRSQALARHPAAAGRRRGVRRAARRAGRDRSHERRRAGVRLQAGIRSEPLRRRHRRGELGASQRFARQAAAQPSAARRLSAGVDDQAVPGTRRADVGQAHARPDHLTTRGSSSWPAPRTASWTTSRAATAASTCTSRSSRPATRTTTCSAARPTSTTRRASCRSSGSAQKTGIDIEGELTGVLPSREWKRQRFAGKNYRDEHRKWYLGDSVSAGIGQGYNAFTPIQLAHAIATIANDGVSFRPHLVKTIKSLRSGEVREVVREPSGTLPVKPEHLAVIKNALVGVNKEGTAAAAFAKAPYVSAGKTGTAQVYSLKGEKYARVQGRRAAARPRAVHRLRPGGQAADRARRAGRERRLRRAGGRTRRTQGVRLLPDRPGRRRPRARAARAGHERRR